ncbi:hypothetical protein KAR91_16130 [Candidatus Pacearchaeota archaeon]|nr:hypothetical protein [Candidatus Pacearchaeota archaeon]
MKKLVIGLALLVMGAVAMAAAPDCNSANETDATATLTAPHDSVAWNVIDSVIVIKTDTCDTHYHATGQAILQPGQRLYIGWVDGETATILNQKTWQVPFGSKVAMTVQWGNYYADSLRSQTDANDSIQLVGAVMGTGVTEKIIVTSTILTATVIDVD